ncbi:MULTISPECIES: AAA family ATPase [unclassified Mesorhizobium]|uniref:AAA family ATPase n=1 Tax=unclassified Mesorhizobium TaxID=325217 RepID=UPI00109387DD|nr:MULTISPECIES: AAA family ATPase [unclassified Mesorhizobium]TGS46274.1 AAA family ATPase [Mesorhizobium sp. M8A.F.Ca.ET.182.01.1.1]TGS81732.1 AAA family ATPase [Mesorhizobium sp. M8A.F.Ca.ET.181.01.1.1]
MIRYTTPEGARSSNNNAFHDKLRQSFPRFLAYCGIMRACRAIPQFRLMKPVVVGLLLPEGADADIYESAARYAAHGASIVYGGLDSTEVLRRMSDRGKKATDGDLPKTLSSKRRVVLVAENMGCVPDSFHLAADAVIQIDAVLPRHIITAAKFCLQIDITPEQAEFIATVPVSVIAAALRRGRPVATAIERMKKAVVPKPREVSGPTLDDLHGIGEAGTWGRELATDLADWRVGKIGWADVDRGILVSGPPGTGKTTFARALARTCDVHLVLGSIARWQAKGHLGDMLKAMRAAFDEANRNAPSILFLDEIDAVGDREKLSGHNAQYSSEVVAALLECIDGAEGREGVVIVGACNHPHRLDAALVRAGRLDRHVRIPLPDLKGREGILRWHLQGLLVDMDLSGVASRTEGWSGASLEQLVRQARRRARRERRGLVLDDIAAELPVLVSLPEEMRRRFAVHEAGHALVCIAIGAAEIVRVSIIDTFDVTAGRVQDGGGVTLKEEGLRERTPAQFLDRIALVLGGLAAEEVLLGAKSAGGGGVRGSDLHNATLSALTFEASYGLGESLAYIAADNEDDLFTAMRFDRGLQERVDWVLMEQFERAKRIIGEHRKEVERIVEALLAKGALSAEEIKEIVEQQPRLKLEPRKRAV